MKLYSILSEASYEKDRWYRFEANKIYNKIMPILKKQFKFRLKHEEISTKIISVLGSNERKIWREMMKLYPIILEIIKNRDSFWFTPDGKQHNTGWQQHIFFLIDNIDKLMSKEEIKKWEKADEEKPGMGEVLYKIAFEKGWVRMAASMIEGKFEVIIEHGDKPDREAMTKALEYVMDNLQYVSKLWIETHGGKVRIFNFKKGDSNNNIDSFFNDYAKYLR